MVIEFLFYEKQKMDLNIFNGFVLLNVYEIFLEFFEINESFIFLILSLKLFKILWKNVRDLFIKLFEVLDFLVYMEVWLFFVDFNVVVVIYKCIILWDYFKVDIYYYDDDED